MKLLSSDLAIETDDQMFVYKPNVLLHSHGYLPKSQ